MPITRLPEADRVRLADTVPGWTLDGTRDAIRRSFGFANFVEAFGFMGKVALLAEKADHHPEWSNIYNRVDILLTTHDVDGLSERDVALAQAINALVSSSIEP